MSLEFDKQVASAASNETVNSFYRIWRAGDLKLRPPFQRNLVWNMEQQSFLVDSILRGLPVPEIYVQRETSAEGEEKTIIVDGQQRISTCIRFISGELRLVDSEELDPRWRNNKFAQLEDDLRKRFRSFQLIVRALPELGDPVLREVFRRLNKTVEPLEAQELRHAAFTGPFVQLIETAASHPVLGEIGVFSAKDYLRRRNDEFVAEVSIAVVSGAFPNKKEGLDELFLTYERQGIPPGVLEDLTRRFGRVFAELTKLASNLRRTRFRNKSDFYSLFVFLANRALYLPLPSHSHDTFLALLRNFSERVNEIKRLENAGEPTDELIADQLGHEAMRYLRSVERAASDRLSRVRRDEALSAVLQTAIAEAPQTKLNDDDAGWRSIAELGEKEAGELDATEEEKYHVQEVLISDADV